MDPDLKRDKNWTYELTAQHELFPRVQVFGGLLSPALLRPGVDRQPGDGEFVDRRTSWAIGSRSPSSGRAIPGSRTAAAKRITLYNLRPAKTRRHARQGYQTNAPDDFRTYNGFEIERQHPAAEAARLRWPA